ncbi:hypothetical protein P154DRAFT_583739 [Amniculicola lignicola CBS 123094]|uniref:Uncharacterized protein n=1 Tax=Amniculicola lignicola CBS 123094 TaxID=1392246 RepID=A0A6A5VVD9_9PLEO|nr:hypothetical protein P154DRAFT_583739 [Amniculicola lignicola CBS 123094]
MPVRASFTYLKLCLVLGVCPAFLAWTRLKYIGSRHPGFERSTFAPDFYVVAPQKRIFLVDLGSGIALVTASEAATAQI